MNHLWLYLALLGAFCSGFLICAMLSWATIERERRAIRRRVDILFDSLQRCDEEECHETPIEAIHKHLVN